MLLKMQNPIGFSRPAWWPGGLISANPFADPSMTASTAASADPAACEHGLQLLTQSKPNSCCTFHRTPGTLRSHLDPSTACLLLYIACPQSPGRPYPCSRYHHCDQMTAHQAASLSRLQDVELAVGHDAHSVMRHSWRQRHDSMRTRRASSKLLGAM